MTPSSAALALMPSSSSSSSSDELLERAIGYCWIQATPVMVAAPAWVNLVAALLSVFGSSCIIINHFCVQKANQNLSRLVTALAVADIVGSLAIATSQAFLLTARTLYTPTLCVAFRAIFQFGFVSSFVWTSCIAVFLYRAAHQKASRPVHYVIMHAVAWVLPLVLVGVSLALDSFEVDKQNLWCRQQQLPQIFTWFLPLFGALLLNGVLYVLIWRAKKRSRSAAKRGKQLSLFFSAFLLCWIWDVTHHIVRWFEPDCQLWPLLMLKAGFTPLQGFLNFLVYGLSFRLFTREHRITTRPTSSHGALVRDFTIRDAAHDSTDDLTAHIIDRDSVAAVSSVRGDAAAGLFGSFGTDAGGLIRAYSPTTRQDFLGSPAGGGVGSSLASPSTLADSTAASADRRGRGDDVPSYRTP